MREKGKKREKTKIEKTMKKENREERKKLKIDYV